MHPRAEEEAMRRRSLLAVAGAAAVPMLRPARAEDAVDVALVLAVDVSRSIDEDEARLQREGYRSALADPVVVAAIRGGMIGAVAVAYVEWAGIEHQRTIIPWQRIASQAQANAWAGALSESPRRSLSWTSIYGGIRHARQVMAECPWEATRRVIDVSADGVNNSGPPADQQRDAAVAEGITINGLPIINDRPTFGRLPPVPLDDYFRENVIGGDGHFMVVAEDFESFGVAVKRKLIREIAGLPVTGFG
jgi:hypothetical protein